MPVLSKDSSKMISGCALAVTLVVLLCPSQILGFAISNDQTPLAATCSAETTGKVFSSILFIDLISAYDPEVIFGLRLPSDIAADKMSYKKLRVLQDKGLRNAEYLASHTVADVSLGKEFTLPKYFIIAGTTIGEFLAERGLLSCGNVIQMATDYFQNVQRAFQPLENPSELETFAGAILTGLEDLLEDFGYTVEENEVNWQILTDTFYRVYGKLGLGSLK